MSDMHLPASGLAGDVLNTEEHRDFHLVTFALGEEYGVPIRQVREIVRVGGITMVPNSPSYMEGVINLRGRVLPVLNLRKRLKLSAVEPDRASRIIVAEVGEKVIGLLVDSVSHVIRVQAAAIESAPEEVLEVDTDYITGVAKLRDGLVILLDLERLLRREKIEVKDMNNEGGIYGEED